jgi:histidyl-tRNA synthetase
MSNKPGIPQGTRDFTAETVRKRQYLFDTIRKSFEQFGFQPLETPAMENLDTLMGKYGEEGDRLIFKILNNGLNDPKNESKAHEGFQRVLEGKSSSLLTERALKYDLTIPFARFVAMNHGTLTFPYKRYQMQPVWRADRPQKGRYREFTQCDADVVGSNSLYNEWELIQLYQRCFTQLGLHGVDIRINHRQILAGLATSCGNPEALTDISVAIDKLDKIGWEKVAEELRSKGIDEDAIKRINAYLSISGTNAERLQQLDALIGSIDEVKAGIESLTWLLERIEQSPNVTIDFTLARGLNYYTGCIFEVKAPEGVQMGSIGGGGRYDDLTGLFGVKGIPGVGISFGIDRIYEVMESLDLFPTNLQLGTQLLFIHMGEAESIACQSLMRSLRDSNISCELYPDAVKIDKQFKYADKKQIPFVAIIGSRELESKTCLIKDMRTGEQTTISWSDLLNFFKK